MANGKAIFLGNTFQLELRQALHFQTAVKPSGAPSCVGAPIIDKHASSFIISSQYGSMLADFRFHRSQLGSPIIRQDTMFALHRNWCPFHRFVLVEKKKVRILQLWILFPNPLRADEREKVGCSCAGREPPCLLFSGAAPVHQEC